MLIRTLLCLALVSGTFLLNAQDDPAVAELLENFFRSNESASESDAQIFLEQLEQWRQHPLDVNTASREDLMTLQLLNELQIEQLISYREKLGNLLNIFELQAVPSWELGDIRRIQPFIEVGKGTLDKRAAPLREGFFRGNNEILIRSSLPNPLPFTSNAEGGPYSAGIRFRHSFDNRLRFGFTAENDAGEAFFNKSNRTGFDFYSAHLFIQNTGGRLVKSVALGDFTARMGQGMLLQTGFSPGKSAESVNLMRGARKLGAYSAFGEAYFLRGAGVTLQLSRSFELNLFGSRRSRDGNLDITQDSTDLDPEEIIFTSLQTSGLHRTPSEIENEGAVKENLGGATFTWINRYGQISANALYIRYDKPFNPDAAPYRRYTFRGQQLLGYSVDHQLRWRNFLFFGENAQSDNGSIALLNGVLIGADRRVTIGVVTRHFEPSYQAIYAAPFAEVSGASNEDGIYTGLEIRPSKPWKINAYTDLRRHPWLRFGVDGPSSGQEYLARVMWQPTRTFQTYTIFQTETKEANAPSPESGLISTRRDRFRIHAGYKMSPVLDLRSRLEWIFFKDGNLPVAKGVMIYQEAVVKPRNFPVSGAVRYALFDTESYDSRVYSFENDLFSAVSIPGFAGRGNRFYVNLSWRISKKWRLEGRYQTTYLERAVTSGSVLGREDVWKLQVRGGW